MAVHRLLSFLLLLLVDVAVAPMSFAQSSRIDFSQFGLTSQQIAAIEDGKAVAKVLPWGGPSEVYVFGAVRVNGSPSAYLRAARDVKQLAGTEGYLGIGELLPDVLPELREYLLRFPSAGLPGADSFFYWEKVSFGLKPTIRLNHAVIYHTQAERRDVDVVAIKQLYASHYFHTALDLSVCVADSAPASARGFYLLTLKGSEQDGLTGLKGSMLRKIVVDKTRSALEKGLASIKQEIESLDANGLAPGGPSAAPAPSQPRQR